MPPEIDKAFRHIHKEIHVIRIPRERPFVLLFCTIKFLFLKRSYLTRVGRYAIYKQCLIIS